MSDFKAAVYAPPGPGMPEVAIIVANGKVISAQEVPNLEEGERYLQHMIQEIAKLADRDAKK